MKFLLKIALGKSVYTVYFFISMVAAIISALYFESEFTINLALIFVFIMGVFVVVSAVVSTGEAVDSLGWPKIKAELGMCKVTVSGQRVGNIGAESFYPAIQYSFNVDDQTYSGNRYSLGERTYSQSAVQNIINNLESNKDNFIIRYNPLNPFINVVKPGVTEVHYIRALVGAAIIVFTVSEIFGWSTFI